MCDRHIKVAFLWIEVSSLGVHSKQNVIMCINCYVKFKMLKFVVLNTNIKHILPLTRLLISMHDRNTIKLHVQVFLRMNTCMFKTCRRHYN